VHTVSEGVQLSILSRELLARVDDGSAVSLLVSVTVPFTGSGGVLINNRSSLHKKIHCWNTAFSKNTNPVGFG